MARRRRVDEEPVNHGRWLVSYADFITLLFAFFVVMYSISSVNEGKYRVLSDTLSQTFSEAKSPDPIQIGEVSRTIVATKDIAVGRGSDSPVAEITDDSNHQEEMKALDNDRQLAAIAGDLESAMSSLIGDELVEIQHNQDWVEVTMKSKMLFESGSARLSRRALQLLRKVTRIIKPLANSVHVEGYTDNIPIDTLFFPSNWELSAARAASVVHLFTRFGVEPSRLAAIGYGEYQPIAENSTVEGRSKNRRIALIILAKGEREGRVLPRVLNDAGVNVTKPEVGQ
ncbi:MAG: flagellar motor protein MotD [Candidatus Polarisedimenticolaceae bacterium]|nr:flagellar motor protein MotD [Candidatus Polarisedimenticolaceae bacterium]